MSDSTEFDKFNAAMDTILKADPKKVKAEMEKDKLSRKFDRALAKLGADPEFQKGVHWNDDAKDNPRLQAMNQAFAEARKKKIH